MSIARTASMSESRFGSFIPFERLDHGLPRPSTRKRERLLRLCLG